MTGETKILSIYTGDLEKYNHHPLYEAIVYAAKKSNLAGATVLKGIMSFGANSQVHSSRLFELSSDLPIKIEIIDTNEKIRAFIEIVIKMFEKSKSAGLISVQGIEVISYMSNK
jgi:PII-like signaling protein